MATGRTKKYFTSKRLITTPMKRKEDVSKYPDNKIDQDFPGFPHGQSRENIITPSTSNEKKIADVNNKDGEKRFNQPAAVDEELSDGSGSAFEGTEEVKE